MRMIFPLPLFFGSVIFSVGADIVVCAAEVSDERSAEVSVTDSSDVVFLAVVVIAAVVRDEVNEVDTADFLLVVTDVVTAFSVRSLLLFTPLFPPLGALSSC